MTKVSQTHTGYSNAGQKLHRLTYDQVVVKLDRNIEQIELCISKIKEIDKRLEVRGSETGAVVTMRDTCVREIDNELDTKNEGFEVLLKRKESYIKERDNQGTHRLRLLKVMDRIEQEWEKHQEKDSERKSPKDNLEDKQDEGTH
ncbi:hypothetical protein MMC06_000108 [Schaereria dolodes]|nr:hypothetical protein [Schaereria dolodes]